MRLFVVMFIGSTAIAISAGCTPPSGTPVSAPMASSSPTSTSTSTSTSTAPAGAPASISVNAATGELQLAREVTFEVRPLNGPGTMGPRVLSASSDGPLDDVRAYLAAHPDAGPLRVEGAANPRTMSGMPTPRWPAGLALQVARRLMEHGVDCKRLDVTGRLDSTQEVPGERVRFFIRRDVQRPSDTETRLDACSARE